MKPASSPQPRTGLLDRGLSRRAFTRRLAGIGLGTVGGSALLAACGGSSATPTAPSAPTTAPAATTAATTAAATSAASSVSSPAAAVSASPAAASSSGPSNVKGTLGWAIAGEPANVDPAIGVDGPSYRVFLQSYEGLVQYQGNTVNLAPALAASWTVAQDGSSIDFKLRPNVKFHDGTTLDAATVKASIERTKVMNRGAAFFLGALKEVQATDAMTVRLVPTQPSVSLLYGLPKVYITGNAHLSDADHGAAYFATNVNGTGPYKLTRWQKGQQLVFDKFDDYWGGWAGNHVAQVIERVVPEAGTQQLLLEQGQIQMAFLTSIGITQDPKSLVAQNANLKMVQSPAFRVTVISMNTQKGPLADARVRQALQLAFDYEGMVKIYQGYADVPNNPLPKGFTAASDPSLPAFKQDLTQAKKLLSDAGHPNGGFSINFEYTETEPQARLVGLLIQSTLQPLGITVNLQSKPFATEAADVAKLASAPDMQATLTMTPRSADPGELLGTLYSSANVGQAYNWAWYKSDKVDQLLAQADKTIDDSQRMATYRDAIKQIMADAPSIWSAYPQLIDVMNKSVQGYVYSPLNYTGVFACYPLWLQE